MGSRFVDFEGGELYLWKEVTEDGRTLDINDVIDVAHEIGFWNVTITTIASLSALNGRATINRNGNPRLVIAGLIF